MKYLSSRLSAYSAAAIAVLSIPDSANAQRYFYDPDPDLNRSWLSWPDVDIEIDLEFDGIEDGKLIVDFSSFGVSSSPMVSVTYKYSGDLQFATYTAVRPLVSFYDYTYSTSVYWPPIISNVPQPLPFGIAITETMNWGSGTNFFWKNRTGDGPGITGIQGKPNNVYLAFRRLGLVDTVYGWMHVNFQGTVTSSWGIALLDYGFQTGLGVPFSTGDTTGATVLTRVAPLPTDLEVSGYCSSTQRNGISVDFTRPAGDSGLPGYQIFLVEESLASSFDLDSAALAIRAKFISVEDFESGPYLCLTDESAQPLVVGNTYRAFVRSLGDPLNGVETSLTAMSDPIVCEASNLNPLLSFEAEDIALYWNSPFRNLKLTFLPDPQFCVDKFRVGISPYLYPLTAEEFYAIPSGNYVEVINNGSGSFRVDFEGKTGLFDSLETDVDYHAYVLNISSAEFPTDQVTLSDSIVVRFSEPVATGLDPANPADPAELSVINGFVQISNVNRVSDVSIYTSDGKRVFTSQIGVGDNTLALADFAAGLYLVVLHNPDQRKSIKFIH